MKSFPAVVLAILFALPLVSNVALAEGNTASPTKGDFYQGVMSVLKVFNLEHHDENGAFWASAYAVARSGCETTINCAKVVLALPDGASGFVPYELDNKLHSVINVEFLDGQGEEILIRGIRKTYEDGGHPVSDRLVTIIVKIRNGKEWLEKLEVTEHER